MQPINEASPVGRKPPAVGALTQPVTNSSSVHPQTLRGQFQPPYQVRPIQAKPQPGTLGQVQPAHKQSYQNPPKPLDQVRDVLRTKHYSVRTEESHIDWIRRYVLFHNKSDGSAPSKWRHPAEMGEKEIEEIKNVLSHLSGKDWIMTALMYGCGLRVDECVTLRVKDIDFERNQIVVRRGKGEKDRPLPLPQPVIPP